MGFLEFNEADLSTLRDERQGVAVVKCMAIRPLAGGVPASEKGVGYFVEHHLGIKPDDPEHAKAVKRIMTDEVGERDDTPDRGELTEKKVYAVNVIRRSAKGPFLLEHMAKACFKVAASRLGYFVKVKGSKGDVSEMGTVLAHGPSLQNPERPWEIYLVNRTEHEAKVTPAETEFHEISGTVSNAQGRKSINHHTEVAKEGAYFEFEFRWLDKKLKAKDVAAIIAFMGEVGIGSVRSLEYGGFKVLGATIRDSEEFNKPVKPKATPKVKKDAKAK